MKIGNRLNVIGITLIELLVALVIAGVVIAGIYRLFVAQTRAYVVQDQVVEVQQNIRTAMEILLRDLRMTGFNGDNTPLSPSVTPGASNITVFYQKNGAVRQVSYSVVGSTLMRNQIPPDGLAGPDPILTDVRTLNFRYGIDPDGDGIVNNASDWVDAGAVGTSKIIGVQVLLEANPTSPNPDLNEKTPRSLQTTVTLRNLSLR
jgi:prepilin-type N-terminal cleavage/methylation domain-containing protein